MLLRIGETRALEPYASPDPATSLGQFEDLLDRFLLDVYLDNVDGRDYGFSIEAFRFLYSLLARTYCLYENESFWLDTSDGLDISADFRDDSYDLRIFSNSSDDGLEFRRRRLTTAEMIVFLSTTIAEVVKSIEAAGFDVNAYLRKYRPGLF